MRIFAQPAFDDEELAKFQAPGTKFVYRNSSDLIHSPCSRKSPADVKNVVRAKDVPSGLASFPETVALWP